MLVTVDFDSPRKREKTCFTPMEIDLWLSGTQLEYKKN